MANSEHDSDYVVAFTHAEDDELAAADAERTSGAAGCFALVLALVIVVVLAFRL
jgi:hypothetical protein